MKKTNNKGFSLVELIIVIAIMAILVGVLAPQYIKYVEKSKKSADLDIAEGVYTAVQTTLTDSDYTIPDKCTVVINATNVTITNGGSGTTSMTQAFDDYFGANWAQKKFKAKACGGTNSYTVSITGTPQTGYKAVGKWAVNPNS